LRKGTFFQTNGIYCGAIEHDEYNRLAVLAKNEQYFQLTDPIYFTICGNIYLGQKLSLPFPANTF
jgi:hypothetical protein